MRMEISEGKRVPANQIMRETLMWFQLPGRNNRHTGNALQNIYIPH